MSEEIANGELQIASTADISSLEFPALPTETEIYILPDGEIVVADLPVELMALVAQLNASISTIEIHSSQS